MKSYPKKESTISAKTYQEQYLSNTRKKGKYNNVRQEYNGRQYDSKLEAKFAQELDYRIDLGEIKEVIPQFKIPIVVNNVHICVYYIDFKVINKDDSITFFEVKGYKTDLWRIKWKLCMALQDQIEPGAEWVVVK